MKRSEKTVEQPTPFQSILRKYKTIPVPLFVSLSLVAGDRIVMEFDPPSIRNL